MAVSSHNGCIRNHGFLGCAPTARRGRRDDTKEDAGGRGCHYCMLLLQFGLLLLKNYGGFR
jgi:hypothetical protein